MSDNEMLINIEPRKSYRKIEILGPFSIIRTYGVTDYRGKYNAHVEVVGIMRPLRHRAEMLVIKDDAVFVHFKRNGHYEIPGGGCDEGELPENTAVRETKEESRIVCSDVSFVCQYATILSEPPEWVQNTIPERDWWYGYLTELYIGKYSRGFSGYVEEDDRDDAMALEGAFYRVSDIRDKLSKIHRDVVDQYLSGYGGVK